MDFSNLLQRNTIKSMKIQLVTKELFTSRDGFSFRFCSDRVVVTAMMGTVCSYQKALQAVRPHLQGGGQPKVPGSYSLRRQFCLHSLPPEKARRWRCSGGKGDWGWGRIAAVMGSPAWSEWSLK